MTIQAMRSPELIITLEKTSTSGTFTVWSEASRRGVKHRAAPRPWEKALMIIAEAQGTALSSPEEQMVGAFFPFLICPPPTPPSSLPGKGLVVRIRLRVWRSLLEA